MGACLMMLKMRFLNNLPQEEAAPTHLRAIEGSSRGLLKSKSNGPTRLLRCTHRALPGMTYQEEKQRRPLRE